MPPGPTDRLAALIGRFADSVRRDALSQLKQDVYAKLTPTPSRVEVVELINEHLECQKSYAAIRHRGSDCLGQSQ